MNNSDQAPGGRPRIGLPVRLSSSSDPDPRVAEANYLFEYIIGLVRDGGGEPVLFSIPPSAADLASLDGVLLPGGGDLDPRLYGEERSEVCYDVNAAQDDLDVAIARRSINAGLPVLGICRGHQLLNVLYGGTLIQDMAPGEVVHSDAAPLPGTGPWAWHDVDVQPGSKVAGLYGAGAPATPPPGVTVKIASGHHQAVARVGDGLVVTAVAGDGTVEALEDPARWVASVQWHPEARELPMAERVAPFRAFVDICRAAPGIGPGPAAS